MKIMQLPLDVQDGSYNCHVSNCRPGKRSATGHVTHLG